MNHVVGIIDVQPQGPVTIRTLTAVEAEAEAEVQVPVLDATAPLGLDVTTITVRDETVVIGLGGPAAGMGPARGQGEMGAPPGLDATPAHSDLDEPTAQQDLGEMRAQPGPGVTTAPRNLDVIIVQPDHNASIVLLDPLVTMLTRVRTIVGVQRLLLDRVERVLPYLRLMLVTSHLWFTIFIMTHQMAYLAPLRAITLHPKVAAETHEAELVEFLPMSTTQVAVLKPRYPILLVHQLLGLVGELGLRSLLRPLNVEIIPMVELCPLLHR